MDYFISPFFVNNFQQTFSEFLARETRRLSLMIRKKIKWTFFPLIKAGFFCTSEAYFQINLHLYSK